MGGLINADVLVFSRDRPAQLELLLRSIDTYAAGVYASVSVLWDFTDPAFAEGYRLVKAGHPDVRWGLEREFELDVRDWLDQAGPTVSFLVDDDVFYRLAPPVEALPWSYRGGDYDYPFSLDGNVYRHAHVTGLLADASFRDPTELEHQGHLRRGRLPFSRVIACRPPCLVGIPANRVSERSGMPHMNVHPAALNERFLRGERLRIPQVPVELERRAHAELELAFETAPVRA